ncbi:hypothetical protein [uncultured Roseobacter sp.]|uniref:hypothetical protein n=1 Tax=uncultured Roseobacter sp. TaxID=114847 RepID=UPI0026171312|nr:hypothetical protein [uncultured Roseobacter sp.]
MKHQRIQPHHADTAIPGLADEAVEARAFKALGARREPLDAAKETITLFQFPDDRTLLVRIRNWWQLRKARAQPLPLEGVMDTAEEPRWRGHWATVKYL